MNYSVAVHHDSFTKRAKVYRVPSNRVTGISGLVSAICSDMGHVSHQMKQWPSAEKDKRKWSRKDFTILNFRRQGLG